MMWATKTSEGIKVNFALRRNNGRPRTGADPSSFSVTVVNPLDNDSDTPAVSESSEAPGLYFFTVTNTFLNANGEGVYPIYMTVDTGTPQRVRDVKSWGLRVTARDLDNVLDAVVDTSDNTTASTALKMVLSMVAGEFDLSVISATIKDFTFKDRTGTNLYRLRLEKDVGRTRTLG